MDELNLLSATELKVIADAKSIIYASSATKAHLISFILTVQAEDPIVYTEAQLNAMTLDQLKALATARTVTYVPEVVKATLVAAILAAQ